MHSELERDGNRIARLSVCTRPSPLRRTAHDEELRGRVDWARIGRLILYSMSSFWGHRENEN